MRTLADVEVRHLSALDPDLSLSLLWEPLVFQRESGGGFCRTQIQIQIRTKNQEQLPEPKPLAVFLSPLELRCNSRSGRNSASEGWEGTNQFSWLFWVGSWFVGRESQQLRTLPKIDKH